VPHKADASFFDAKRDWSLRKDQILADYLKLYLAKVSKLRRPILVVDGFAGPGLYGDGGHGSPLIIAGRVAEKLAGGLVPITALCIEYDPTLYGRLERALTPYPFAQTRRGTFLEHLPEVERLAKGSTTFLYVDPYAIEGLEWAAMERIFRYVRDDRSVEILLNFAAASFVRRGLAAFSLAVPQEAADVADANADPPSAQRLNDAVGGDWWQPIVRDGATFTAKVEAVTRGYCDRLRHYFREVCEHPIRAKWDDAVPKYSLVFASRHVDALLLMNDRTIKSRDKLAEQASTPQGLLFEVLPPSLAPDVSRLPQHILAHATRRVNWKALKAAVVRDNFCQYTESQINQAIKALLAVGRLASSTGESKVDDNAELWRPAPP
jgi:three-Cys-motif partner protein